MVGSHLPIIRNRKKSNQSIASNGDWSHKLTGMEKETIKCTHFRTAYPFIITFVGIMLFIACQQVNRGTLAEELRCCNMINPEGIDAPLLSWKIKSSQQGIFQTAWEIEIASSRDLLERGDADIWKSGKQISDKQFGIQPASHFMEGTSYYWRVRIWDHNDQSDRWSDPTGFSIGLLQEESWIAKWITYPNAEKRALPYFRKKFVPDQRKKIDKAWVFFCGLGAGELYLNGQQVDPSRFLDPAQTNYDEYALYSTFDVTSHITKGENVIGVMLGDGWFSQDDAWGGADFSYGDPMFRLQMKISYTDGTHLVVGSNDEWEWAEGPIRKSNIYLGETYDANHEIENWHKSESSSDGWEKAVLATSNTPPRLIPQMIPPIRKKETLSAENIWQDSLGNWIYDFGVNVAAIPLLKVKQPKGTKVTIRFAEGIDSSKGLDFQSTGWIHHGDIFKDQYICRGEGVEEWSPRFTYHGYRYAELSGLSGKPNAETLKLIVVHSDVGNTGQFACANEQINKLHELAIRTVKSNLHGIPTDCPIREKCGWLGDVHAYVKMANVNFQLENFWHKYLEDIRSGASKEEKNTLFHERYNNTFYFTDKAAGIPYMIAPGKRLCGVASPDWGTVQVQLPWWIYVYYGNKQLLSDYYPLMRQWTLYVHSLAKDNERKKQYDTETNSIVYQGLGDWCPPKYEAGIKTPVAFTSTAFHFLDTKIMKEVAGILGKTEDEALFSRFMEEIATELISVMYDPVNHTFGSQTADAMALDLGIVPEGDERAVSGSIVENMKTYSEGFMHCGIFGLSRIGSMLARHGNAEAAWQMFTRKGEHSFEWMWSAADATTLWESLPVNEITRKGALSASYNHPMQAGYDITFFEDMAGIAPDPSGFGFKVIRFEPLFCDYLPWAKAQIETSYGVVASNWEKSGEAVNWEITIPPNSTGLVIPPYEGKCTVNGEEIEHCTYLKMEKAGDKNQYSFPSGTYQLIIHPQ